MRLEEKLLAKYKLEIGNIIYKPIYIHLHFKNDNDECRTLSYPNINDEDYVYDLFFLNSIDLSTI